VLRPLLLSATNKSHHSRCPSHRTQPLPTPSFSRILVNFRFSLDLSLVLSMHVPIFYFFRALPTMSPSSPRPFSTSRKARMGLKRFENGTILQSQEEEGDRNRLVCVCCATLTLFFFHLSVLCACGGECVCVWLCVRLRVVFFRFVLSGPTCASSPTSSSTPATTPCSNNQHRRRP
jgi:hypothetical protein